MDHDFDEIVRTFVVESEENLRALDEGFVVLESHPDDAEVLATIFRMAHTLKGNAASLGYVALAEFAHGMEDTLDRLRQRKLTIVPALATLLLRGVDALRELVLDATSGTDALRPPHRALMAELSAATRAAATARADEKAPPAPRVDLDTGVENAADPKIRAEDIAMRSAASADPHSEASANGDRHRAHDAAHDAAHDGVMDGKVAQPGAQKTLRVDIERLNRMLDLVGEIAIERGRLRGAIDAVNEASRTLGAPLVERHVSADALYAELQEMVMKLRMVPIGPTFRQQSRTVRDVAAALGKQVRLAVEGEAEEMDTALVELIKDPLTHMIRNAIDHGIEAPDARKQQGKDPTGTLTLRARQGAGNIFIEVSDDGRGLPRAKIAERAKRMGIENAGTWKDRDLYELIFEPGFSTAATVTDISGRGVGMDVVRKNVQALRGTIGIESHEGAGTTFRVRLPLTVAMIDGFAVTAGAETYLVPLDRVVECMDLPAEARAERGVIKLRGEPIPFFRLRDVFRLAKPSTTRESMVVLQHEDANVGLAVDEILGVSQVVIKPPGKLLDTQPGLSGSTIMGTGQVAFILDVPGLVRLATHERDVKDRDARGRSA